MKTLFTLEARDVNLGALLEEKREQVRRLNAEFRKAKEGTDEYKRLAKEVADTKNEVRDLTARQREVNREFKALSAPRDSLVGLRLEYSKLTAAVSALSAAERQSGFGKELIANAARVKAEIDGIEQSIGRFTGNVGNYKSAFDGIGTTLAGLAATLGLGFGADVIIDENKKISDSIANVQKTASITEAEARKLSDALRFRDTRTSLADQLDIAAIGGQLGIATDQLQAFTEGTDVLNVALGDQFSNVEELTRQFAGLRNVLTDFKTENVANDILKIGNAINVLEAEGSATAPTIVEFANRIAGAGIPLGATTDKILGLSTVLAELNVTPERGATAVTRLLSEIAKAPDTFAKVVGQSAGDFRKLVESDIVGALTLVSKAVANGTASNVEFAKLLDSLGIEAAGATEVLGKLGGNVDLLNTRVGQSQESLRNTNSITAEFESKNNNAAAAIDKLKNALVNLFTGNNTQDLIEGVAVALTKLIDLIAEAPAATLAFGGALIFLKREMVATATASLAQNTAIAASTGAFSRATIAAYAHAAAQNAIPAVGVAVAIYGLVKAFELLASEADNASAATNIFADAQARVTEESAKEIAQIQASFDTLRSDTALKSDKKKAIDALLKQYPDYLRGVDLEKASTAQLNDIQKELTENIVRGIAIRQKAIAQEELLTKSVQARLKAQDIRTRGFDALERGLIFGDVSVVTFGVDKVKETEKALQKAEKEAADLQEQARLVGEQFDKAFNLGNKGQQVENLAALDELEERAINAAANSVKAVGEIGKVTGAAGKGVKAQKKEVDLVADSLAFLRKQAEDLRKQLENTPPQAPQFPRLIKDLELAEAKIKALEDRIKGVNSLNELDQLAALQQGERELSAISLPDRPQELTDAQVEAAIEANAQIVANEEFTAEQIAAIRQALADKLIGKTEEEIEAEKKAAEERANIRRQIEDAAIESAQSIANAVFEIQSSRVDREREAQLNALDIEYERRLQNVAQGSAEEAKIKAEFETKKEAIEKKAAKQRQNIAIKEAVVQGALNVIKSLSNPFLAAAVAIATAAQIAIIKSQQFERGGAVKFAQVRGKRHSQGGIKGVFSDGTEIEVEDGENLYVLNRAASHEINRLSAINQKHGGKPLTDSSVRPSASYAPILPLNFVTHHRPRYFQAGGVLDFVPQTNFAGNLKSEQTVLATMTFTDEQMQFFAETVATKTAKQTGQEVRTGLAQGLNDNNRLLERQNAADKARRV